MSQSIREQLISLGFKPTSQVRTKRHRNRPSRNLKQDNSNFARKDSSSQIRTSINRDKLSLTPQQDSGLTRKDVNEAQRNFHNYKAGYRENSADGRSSIKRESSHAASLEVDNRKATANVPPVSKQSHIVSIEPDAKLVLTKQADLSVYKLRTDATAGVDPRFDDDGVEVTIGLDFGTSSVKAVLKVESDFIAVPFMSAEGIDAYLLPTLLRRDSDGAFTLSPDAHLSQSALKLALLANPSNCKAQINAGIFLALVLRHIRSWFFDTYSKYDGQDIAWECAIGYPSTENDSQTEALWKELLYRSWQLSVQPGEITLSVAEDIWQHPIESFEDIISFDYFRSMPEVVAAIAGFNRNQPIVDDFKGNYTLVDIGSGTVDISTFAYTKTVKQYQYNRTPFSSKVEQLGTTNCHHKRLEWLRKLLMTAAESSSFTLSEKAQFSRFIKEIDVEKKHSLLEPLRDSVTEYLSGIRIEPSSDSADVAFSKKLTSLIGRVRKEAVDSNFVDTNDVAQMPVFLCGGGARSKFYRKAFMEKHPNITWLAPRVILQTHVIKELAEELFVPIEQGDYDRLLVAYGLSAELPPKTHEATRVDSRPVKEANPFIDKDMV